MKMRRHKHRQMRLTRDCLPRYAINMKASVRRMKTGIRSLAAAMRRFERAIRRALIPRLD